MPTNILYLPLELLLYIYIFKKSKYHLRENPRNQKPVLPFKWTLHFLLKKKKRIHDQTKAACCWNNLKNFFNANLRNSFSSMKKKTTNHITYWQQRCHLETRPFLDAKKSECMGTIHLIGITSVESCSTTSHKLAACQEEMGRGIGIRR